MSDKRRKYCLVLLLGVSISLFSFGRQWKGKISIRDGIHWVENTAEPLFENGSLRLIKEVEIPGSDPQGRYLFVRPGNLTLDGNGNLYVMDWKEACIYVFSESRQFVRTIGRPGVGPGELSGLTDFLVTKDRVIASCGMNRKIVFFTLDGTFVKTIAAPYKIISFRADNQGAIFGIILVPGTTGSMFELVKFDGDFRRVEGLASREQGEPYSLEAGLSFDILPGGDILVGAPSAYEFKIFDSQGKVVRSIKKNSPLMKLSREEISLFIKSRGGSNAPVPQYYAPYYKVRACDADKIIVNTHTTFYGGRREHNDLFDLTGKYLMSFCVKSYQHQLWRNGRLYVTDETEEGEPVIRVFKVVFNH